ncbi:MAG: hypothetical protein RL042_454 [Nitrospirota bacterium]|jgi:hypothetical protein
MPQFWHAFTWLRSHATIVPARFLYVKRKHAQSVATLGTARFISAEYSIGLFSGLPTRDQFDVGFHSDRDSARLDG